MSVEKSIGVPNVNAPPSNAPPIFTISPTLEATSLAPDSCGLSITLYEAPLKVTKSYVIVEQSKSRGNWSTVSVHVPPPVDETSSISSK